MSASPRSVATSEPDHWRLRPVGPVDIDGLHALASQPLVYRYLFDGVAPDRAAIAEGIARAMADAARTRLGMWMLEGRRVPHGGCVLLRPDPAVRSAELTYLLDPALWGRGLATRMAWTAIQRAFREQIDRVLAGTDGVNTASVAVMRRLGMRFHCEVSYPLGPGVEYALTRAIPGLLYGRSRFPCREAPGSCCPRKTIGVRPGGLTPGRGRRRQNGVGNWQRG